MVMIGIWGGGVFVAVKGREDSGRRGMKYFCHSIWVRMGMGMGMGVWCVGRVCACVCGMCGVCACVCGVVCVWV